MLKGVMIVAVAIAGLATGARDAEAQAVGYALVGPAGSIGSSGVSNLFGHAGAGGELLIAGRAGLSAEHGWFAGVGGGMWITSANLVIHLGPADRTRGTRAFVTGGRSRLSGGDIQADVWNLGGGVDIWARERVGVRVEMRDHILAGKDGSVHYWSLRAGIAFR